jgi:osmoprotectant transport system permease protein
MSVDTGLLQDVRAHLELAGAALLAGALIAIPLGVAAAHAGAARGAIVGVAAVGRTLPSLAVLTFILPFLGVGFWPATVALTLLAIPPIVINTDLGLRGVDPAALDAARGMGMTRRQAFGRVAWPLALPSVVTGLRTAAIEVVASATLATFVGAGGLGVEIVRGLQTGDDRVLYQGAVAVALLALAVELLGGLIARRIGATT